MSKYILLADVAVLYCFENANSNGKIECRNTDEETRFHGSYREKETLPLISEMCVEQNMNFLCK